MSSIENIIIECKDWSGIKNDIFDNKDNEVFTSSFNKDELTNLGIYQGKDKGDEELYRTKGFVGVVRLKNKDKENIIKDNKEVILQISPRFKVEVMDMLNKLQNDKEFGEYLTNDNKNKYTQGDIDETNNLFHFFDEPPIKVNHDISFQSSIFVASLFINLLQDLCRKPLYGKMEKVEQNLTGRVKGKILFNKNIKLNTARARQDRIYCQYQQYTTDILENQILKAALYKARRFISDYFSSAYVGDSGFTKKIKFCTKALEKVSEKKIKTKECDQVKIGGLYSYYKTVLKVAKMILGEISISPSGKAETSGYISPYAINMEKLFEFYARAIVREAIEGNDDIVLEGFNSSRQAIKEDIVLDKDDKPKIKGNSLNYISGFVKPDIILKVKEEYIVLDVKYKDYDARGYNRNDRLQIFAYGLLYNCKNIGIIFPSKLEEDIDSKKVAKRNEHNITENNFKVNILGNKEVTYSEIVLGRELEQFKTSLLAICNKQ